MDQNPLVSISCQECGAPLSLEKMELGAVTCKHCGAGNVLRSRAELRPEVADRFEFQARSFRRGATFSDALRQFIVLLISATAGLSVTVSWIGFFRLPHDYEALWPVLSGVCLVFALVWRRRIFAVLIGGFVGVLTAARPVAGKWDGSGVFSEEGLLLLIPGLVLLGLGIASAAGISRSNVRKELNLLRPGVSGAIGFLAGIALAYALFGGTTNRNLLDENEAFLKTRGRQYTAFFNEINTSPGAPGRGKTPFSPLPVYIEGDAASNTDILPVEELPDTADYRSFEHVDLNFESDLATALKHYRMASRYDDWDRDPEFHETLNRAIRTRYTVAYQCRKSADEEHAFVEDCRGWVFDLSTRQRVLTLEFGTFVSYGAKSNILQMLSDATGGSFRDQSR